ncbi:GvpL/GvpF family gas vesicle protein [Streptomyces sp. NPDC053493]|uniref:GvpL/GvpF family gas vesicle protein n=1 Tax=Streptomyces sp. NPDC053493 TaxID=3365705 RepID=UPI0037D3E46B
MNASEGGEATVTYVYAVASPTDALRDRLGTLRGIADAPVRLLAGPGATGPDEEPDGPGATGPDEEPAGLAFVVSPVPRADFDETALKERFEDLAWLETVARAHHDVVQALAAHATVLPLRMATIYEDDERARQALTDRYGTFAERLARLRARTEYGVKISLPPATADVTAGTAAPAREADTAAPEPPTSPGKAYLQRRRVQHHAREAVHAQAQRAAAALEEIAARYASDRVRHAPQRGTLAGPAENVLNDSYLVPDDQAEAFRAAVARAAEDFPDVRVDVTGPWAPYSFAMPPADSEP